MTLPVGRFRFRDVCRRLAALAVLVSVAGAARDAVAIRVEAYAGEPFGVGVVTLDAGGAGPVAPLEDDRFTVRSADGRVLYSAVKGQPPVRRLIRQLLEIQSPSSATIYFLFRGDAPLQLEAFSPTKQTGTMIPRIDERSHARLMNEWREAYVARWKSLRQNSSFPPVVENFLAANLARRMGFRLPDPSEGGLLNIFAPKKTVWSDLFLAESAQLDIDEQILTGAAPTGPFGPLPPQLPWPDLRPESPPAVAEGELPPPNEPIAAHVPAECFYARFGNFTNYLWFRDLKKKWDGDLANMILRRGVDRASAKRIEQQLSLRENVLAKILGPQVIADVAIIGLDVQTELGAAVGVLFQAKNSALLGPDLVNQRREALTKFKDATETTVKIGGRDVSLIATPLGEVRSYYVADGDFHLVTTSKRLVERFLEAGEGTGSLADSVGFKHVRRQLATDRDDAIFVYVSPEFIRNQTAPPLWIETQRRARSAREIKLLELARLEAAAEGSPAKTIADLVAGGFLPQGFGQHADGGTLVEEEGALRDSLRGVPGYFIPADDIEAVGASGSETAAYRLFSDRFHQEVGQTPPIAVGVRRVPLKDGSGETMAADVYAGPLEGVKLGKLPDSVGAPSTDRVAPVPGDLVHGEVVLKGTFGALLGQTDPHHLFFAIRDFRSMLVARQGQVTAAGGMGELFRMYLGAWPKAGVMQMFAGPNPPAGPEPVPAGKDLWQARRDDFMLISFKPEVVNEVLPQLAIIQAERPAQIWLDVQNLTGTELAVTLSALGYQRTREASLAACRLMNALTAQLHVPAAECRELGEQLVDGTFICPLGGEYKLTNVPGGEPLWTSTAVAEPNRFLLSEPPADFTLPALTWFQGLRGDALFDPAAITAHVEIDMAKSAVP